MKEVRTEPRSLDDLLCEVAESCNKEVFEVLMMLGVIQEEQNEPTGND